MDSVNKKRSENQLRDLNFKSQFKRSSNIRAPSTPFSKSKNDYHIPTLPDLERNRNPSFEMFGGHLPSTNDPNTNSHLYFNLIQARHKTDKTKTMFWFNGGPGCSSFDGLMMETGPFGLVKLDNNKLGLKEREYGWHEYANVVYVDQPVGTGYSYAQTDSYVHDISQAASQFVTFLDNFYQVFPELKNTDVYLSGESFAGQYIPYFADAILNTPELPLNLKGLIIGNGWIDPITQYPAYADFVHEEGIIEAGSKDDKRLMRIVDDCDKALKTAIEKEADGQILPIYIPACENIMDQISSTHTKTENGQKTCMNVYDYRLRDSFPECGMNWPPEINDVTAYLRQENVAKAFNARKKAESWTECNFKVGKELTNIHTTASVRLLPKLLEKTKILFYVGDKDIICNYVGFERLIENLQFNGGTGFESTEPKLWSLHDELVGEWTSERNLSYVRIYNSSHMTPIDQPEAMLDLVTRFMEVDLKSVQTNGDVHNFESIVGDVNQFGEEDGSASFASSHKKLGSFALLIIFFGLVVGGFFWFRRRQRNNRIRHYSQLNNNNQPSSRDYENAFEAYEGNDEERQQLHQSSEVELDKLHNGDGERLNEEETIFSVGDDIDNEEDANHNDLNKH